MCGCGSRRPFSPRQLRAFRNGECGKSPIRIARDIFEQALEISQQARNGGRLIQIGVVFASQAPSLIAKNQKDVQIV
jgi:hypothetical protein